MKKASFFLGVAALAVAMLAADGMAQRRGGAVSSGVRGAMVGGMVGGESGAAAGAKAGAVVGATRTVVQNADQRRAMTTEAQAYTTYQTSPAYATTPHSNFYEAAPQVLTTSTPAATAAPGSVPGGTPIETIIRKAGKPIVGITYPADWKQKADERSVSAVSPKGDAWSALALVDGLKDKAAGIAKAKQELEKSLQDIKYDEPTETERGALVVTGTGKGKKAGVEVVFAVGIFEPAAGQLGGAVFIVDKDVEDHYKELVRYTCSTIRGEKDLAAPPAGK